MKATIDIPTLIVFWILWLLSYSLHETLVRLDGDGSWPILSGITQSGYNLAYYTTIYFVVSLTIRSMKGTRDESQRIS